MLTASVPVNIGRYEIKSLIGRGGMGDLYLARDPNTSRLVALKLLNASLRTGDLRDRFAREARALATLNHPNIVTIYDYGEFQGSPFIVMEYVRGETLSEKIKRRAPLTMGQKLKLMSELCAGLAQAHEAGIIHRDIKPANLMVEQHDRLKILDFGIARVAEGNLTRVGLQMTQVNMRIGTPGYMSPEQIEGLDIDHRSDLFAVGTVFYELLAYREAFSGGSTRQIENKVLEARPTPLQSLIRDIDPEITAIVARALEKDPARRFRDATEFEQALEHQRWRLGPSGNTPPPIRHTPPTPSPSPAPGRGSRDARADAAYQRSLAVFQDGAEDAARRFAIEALAEDPNHLGARSLLEQLDPHGDIPTPPPPASRAGATPPTQVSSPESAATVVRRNGADRPGVWATVAPLWKRYQRPALVSVSIVLGVVVVAGLIFGVGGWLSSGRSLTITRPTGGTVFAAVGITCGTLGSECQANPASGDTIQLRAQPDEGYVVGGFTGDCLSNGRVTMTSSRICGATFERVPVGPPKPLRTLTITPPGKGGTIIAENINCGSQGTDCTTTYPDGKQVSIEGLADKGFTVTRYTGACVDNGQTVMTEARTCGAVFEPIQVRAPAPVGGPSSGPPPRSGRDNQPPAVPPVILQPLSQPSTSAASGGAGASSGGEGVVPPKTTSASSVPVIGPTLNVPPPIPLDASAKSQIDDVLKRYCKAYESLDIDEVKAIYPKVAESVKRQLKGVKNMQCSWVGAPEYDDPDFENGTAKLSIGMKQVYNNSLGREETLNLMADMTLLRPERGRWIIESARFRPVKK